MSAPTRVLVVDDQRLFLDGLVTVLELRPEDVAVIGVAMDGRSAVEQYRAHRPDVVLLDIKMPGMDGVEAAREIRRQDPDARILMLTTFDDVDLIQGALEAGARGYVLKDMPVDQVLLAIRTVHGGGVTFSDRAFRSINPAERRRVRGTRGRGEQDQETATRLSPQQRRVLHLISLGKSNRQIADELGISEKTVRNYLTEIYDVIDVHSRTQALLWALRHQV